MAIYEEQIFPGFEGELLFSQPVSLASPRPLLESGEARKMTVGSGRQCSMLLDQSSPLGAFSKILLGSSRFRNSKQFCYVWRVMDTRFGFSAFQLTQLAQITSGNGSLLWRSPQAGDITGGGQNGEKRLDQGHAMKLCDQAKTPKLWPTPVVNDARNGRNETANRSNPDSAHHAGTTLSDAVRKLWPTPVTEYSGRTEDKWKVFEGEKRGGAMDLQRAAKLWPTPTGGDAKASGSRNTPQSNAHGGNSLTDAVRGDGGTGRLWPTPTQRDWKSTGHGNQDNARPLSEAAGQTGTGSLNPEFVEWLQGFPIGHTQLKEK